MTNARPLLVAVPAFALGCLLTASLTTTARAEPARKGVAQWTYRVAMSQNEMVSLTNHGWEYVGESAATEGSQSSMSVDRRYTLRMRE